MSSKVCLGCLTCKGLDGDYPDQPLLIDNEIIFPHSRAEILVLGSYAI